MDIACGFGQILNRTGGLLISDRVAKPTFTEGQRVEWRWEDQADKSSGTPWERQRHMSRLVV